MDASVINLNQIGSEYGATIIGDNELLIALLHRTFLEAPEFKEVCTEALLTFDTEDGGKTMNLEAADVEKEEQP